MFDVPSRWLRLPDLPDDILAEMPAHVGIAFCGARRHGFEVEMFCPGIKVPSLLRSRRRLVVVADDGDNYTCGPDAFDLTALEADIRASRRAFVIAVPANPETYSTAYASAVEDLAEGSEAAVIVETAKDYRQPWLDTLMSLRSRAPEAVAAAVN